MTVAATRRAAAAPTSAVLDTTLRAPNGSISLRSAVLTASGCSAAGRELQPYVDLRALGAVVTKSVMARPRSGRGTPRMAETPSGMLNSIGLQGPGIDAFIAEDLAWLADHGVAAVVSIAGEDIAEFAGVAETLHRSLAGSPDLARTVVAVEVNISCPNVANRGLVFACDPAAAADVITAVREQTDRALPVLAKLSPDVTDIAAIAGACLAAGADGLTLINTTLGVAIDTDRMAPALARVTGGLSGPAMRPIAVRCVWQVHAAMRAGVLPDAPIIGVGGIRTGRDAAQFVLAGAAAVQVGTAGFADPGAPQRVAGELAAWLAACGEPRLSTLVGRAHEAVG